MSLARYTLQLLGAAHHSSTTLMMGHTRSIKRWVAPTLREIRKRKNKMGPQAETPRSTFSDWNYDAEVFAFAKRLNEEFDSKVLRQAFISRSYVNQERSKQESLGIEGELMPLEDNQQLIDSGEQLINNYVNEFIRQSLSNLPQDGVDAIRNSLTSVENLAVISKNIGTKDLILSSEFPVSSKILADTFKAVVGAIALSSEARAKNFVKDFVCTQLNQKDLTECWNIQKPFDVLRQVCEEKGINEVEPRILGEKGKNTVLAAYHVGIYVKKKLLATGFGENIEVAVDAAALQCLRDIYGISENMRPFSFEQKTI